MAKEDEWGSEDEKCVVCNKAVWGSDKLSVDGKIMHKTCLKCSECNTILRLGTYASLEGTYYCKPHFKQLFLSKGNYSEGFGVAKPTAKWDGQTGGTGELMVKVEAEKAKGEKVIATKEQTKEETTEDVASEARAPTESKEGDKNEAGSAG